MRESRVLKETLVALSQVPGVRVWRQNTGVAYGVGEVKQCLTMMRAGDLMNGMRRLASLRPVKYGVPGQADITGVGPGGVRLEIECKDTKGSQQSKQRVFERVMRTHDCIYMLVRNPEQAKEKLMIEIEEWIARQDAKAAREAREEADKLEDIVRWFEHMSGKGEVYLERSDYDDAVVRGDWEPNTGG